MATAYIRFYEELNDFLPPAKRKAPFAHPVQGRVSVKDMIEALGVPHTEVELILVNGLSRDFTYLVQDGDRISVYPVFESLDVTPLLRVRPRPLRETRFVLDTHLGKLAAYLRMLGFDTLYRNDFQDEHLARLSSRQERILLTRDRGLLKRSIVTHGYCVRHTKPWQQLVEVVERFDLTGSIVPFQRCLCCNELLEPVEKEVIKDRLQPTTRHFYNEFRVCPTCGKIYWKGSHYQRMRRFIECILQKQSTA